MKLLLLLLITICCCSPTLSAQTPRQPNIILICADDLGYDDVGYHRRSDLKTPHIDGLVRTSARFTDAYASAPVCSPSRAGLLTGRYQQRFGHEFNPGVEREKGIRVGLPLSEPTLADHLKKSGYATALVGKWHLGVRPQFHPLQRGFDEFFGFLPGTHPYYAQYDADRADHLKLLRNNQPVPETDYLTDAFTREAVAFIQRNHTRPFFLYLAYNAPHPPLEKPPAKYHDRFPEIDSDERRTFAATVAAIDDGIGAILQTLAALKLDSNTLIIFVGDNGSTPSNALGTSATFAGLKGSLLEGGLRVPLLIHWNNRIPPAIIRQPVITLDVAATALAAAGTKPSKDHPLDGLDLFPLLTDPSHTLSRNHLFWRYGESSAIRGGPWKLLRRKNAPPELFYILSDPRESNNVASRFPQITQDLSQILTTWESTLPEPLWFPRQGQHEAEEMKTQRYGK